MHKRLLTIYGLINTWLFYPSILLMFLLIILQLVFHYIPELYNPCPHPGIQWADISASMGIILLFLLVVMTVVSLFYIPIGIFELLSAKKMQYQSEIKKLYHEDFMKCFVGLITVFLLFLLFQFVTTSLSGIYLCPPTLPALPPAN